MLHHNHPYATPLNHNFKIDARSLDSKEFKGELINVSTGIENRQIVNLKSSIDYNNVIHLELMTDGGETLDIYSSPSLENPYETIVFAVNDGIVTDEIPMGLLILVHLDLMILLKVG